MIKRLYTILLCLVLISNFTIGDDIMALTKPNWVTNTIQSLPNIVKGQSTSVKQKFDKAASDIKDFTTNLIDEIEAQFLTFATKNEITNLRKLSSTGNFTGTWNSETKESIDNKISSANSNSQNALTKTDMLENQFSQLVINAGSSNAEIVAARVREDGTTFESLPQRLNSVDAELLEQDSQIYKNSYRDIFPQILDMHYGVLKGVGWKATEPGGEITKTITAGAAKGSLNLTLSGVVGIVPGQLIVICSDGEYYTNVVNAVNGLDVSLNYPLETNIAISDTVHNFYINSTHPNTFGYKAIADATIRNMSKPIGYKLLSRLLPSDFTFSGTGTNADGGYVKDYSEPFAVFDTKVLTETRQAIKAITLDNDCFLKLKTYVKSVDGAIANIQISNVTNSISYYNKNYSGLGRGTSDTIETVVFLRKGSYNIKLKNTVSGKTLVLGKTEIYELSQKPNINAYDNGVHLLLGDSWFEIETLPQRLKEKFPHATFINFGVGGNQLDNLIRRFTGTATDADIKNDPVAYGDRKDATAVTKIDYVWVMCGTNDYNASKTNDTYKSNMDTLINAIIDRGAKPLVFTSSVGSIADSNNFTLSRQYADLYYNQQYNAMIGKDSFLPLIIGSTTAGSNTYNIQTGTCKKIGSIVYFTLTVRMSVKDTAMAGNINISGLPYVPAAVTPVTLGRVDYVTYNTGKQLIAQIETSGLISISKIVDNGYFASVTAADVTNNTIFTISGSFMVD